ncbi:septal ring lytic transglycosylase RlpA family protein [Desulfocurvus sp. DL9XJH121]
MEDWRRRGLGLLCCILLLALALSGCGRKIVPTRPDGAARPSTQTPTTAGPAPKGTFKPYTVSGRTYYPLATSDGYVERGVASWYGPDFHGRKTANGETYDMHAMTCAHKVLPMNTYVRVTNEANGRVATLRVNDRGPFVANRIVDLSRAGAQALDMLGPGTAQVRLEAVGVAGSKPVSVARAVAQSLFYVQVGSFTERANAERMQESLRAAGYVQTRVERAQVKGRTFWRVQAGAFRGMDRANKAHAALKREYPRSFLIAD